MDKSPALENFMNKMAVMQGKGQPKMSATTMKIGSGGLEKRIANNERKITAIKNITEKLRDENLSDLEKKLFTEDLYKLIDQLEVPELVSPEQLMGEVNNVNIS